MQIFRRKVHTMECIPHLETSSRNLDTFGMKHGLKIWNIEISWASYRSSINLFTNLLVDRLDEQRRLVIHRKFQAESKGENREKSEILLDNLVSYLPPLLECMTVGGLSSRSIRLLVSNPLCTLDPTIFSPIPSEELMCLYEAPDPL